MNAQNILPKRLVRYIHETGVRALDHLAANLDSGEVVAPNGDPHAAAEPSAVQNLVNQWKTMSSADKDQFVERVATSVIAVVAASAALPLGLKVGKKSAKAAKKALRKKTKQLKKAKKQSKKGTKAKQQGKGKGAAKPAKKSKKK